MKIFDATVRDGSYAVDFKFSLKDVSDLVAKSERIGIEYIEIGHGMGLNASSPEHGLSLHSDVEYMKAARNIAKKAKLGFFCIPGIARLDDLKTAKENGMDFIRIGVPVRDYEKAVPFLKEAKERGLEAFVNFMKSYTASPEEFASASKFVAERGAFAVYIVDSAGSMTEGELASYIKAVREVSDVTLGFHGHNNLGLAVGNSIFCAENGVEFIDCTYQGLGRSIGNTPLEQFVMAMERQGHSLGFDVPCILEYGYSGLRNIVHDRILVNPLDYVCGYAGFHSSFLKDIYRCCMEKEVDPLRLIIAYSKINQISMDYEQLCKVADSIPKDYDDNPYSFAEYFSEKYCD